MGVPAKKQSRKGKKGSQKAKKVSMWGGSPASAMLFDDLANPTNTGNYLDADIPLVANQTKAPLTGGSACSSRPTMTGGSLSSSAVLSAVNTVREPGAQLNDYEAGMNLTGCGSKKAVITGGSAAAVNVMKHVNLPSVLEPQAVTSSVPDYLSLDPAARPPSTYELTGGNANNNNFAQGPPQRQYAMVPEQMPQPAHPPVVEDVVEPVVSHGKGPKAPKHKRTKRAKTVKGSSKRTSKRPTMTGGADRPNGAEENPYAFFLDRMPERAGRPEPQLVGEGPVRRLYANAPGGANLPNRHRNQGARLPQVVEEERANRELYAEHGPQPVKAKKNKRSRSRKGSSSRDRAAKRPTMTGGASGFWSGVAGCGPVNVPNAGNNLSRFFTKSSSCPGPEFYANPPGLGSAGSGYATELPTGAPFPFI